MINILMQNSSVVHRAGLIEPTILYTLILNNIILVTAENDPRPKFKSAKYNTSYTS